MSQLPTGAVVFEGVSKRYRLGALGTLRSTLANLTSRNGDGARDFWALKDVSFRVEPGESLGLIGPNGAGKTTTLKLLSNITQPTSGRIEVSGRLSSLIELGAGFHPELSGRDNIFLNGAILGLKRREIQRKLDAIIAFSELERFIDTPVKRYSSGMYVRLGFAVAAHVEPDILLVDEVLAVGDASFRHRCTLRMQALKENGTTIIFVSHNMHMVRNMCEGALLLKGGKMRAWGATAEVIAEYDKSILDPGAQSVEDLPLKIGAEDSHVIKLTTISVSPPSGHAVAQNEPLQSDSPAVVQIEYESNKPQVVGRIDVRILRDDGTLCSAFDNHMAPQHDDSRLNQFGHQGYIKITLDPVQLTSGRYYLLVQITDVTDAMVIASAQSEYFTVFTRHAIPSPGVFVPCFRWEHSSST